MATPYYRPLTILNVAEVNGNNQYTVEVTVHLRANETLQLHSGDPQLVGGVYLIRYSVINGNTNPFTGSPSFTYNGTAVLPIKTSVTKGDIYFEKVDSTDKAEPASE